MTGINTPLLYPDANDARPDPEHHLGGIPNVATVGTTSVFGTFDQRFVINNFIDNLTKVTGKHTLQVRRLLPARLQREQLSEPRAERHRFLQQRHQSAQHRSPLLEHAAGVYNSYTQASTKVKQSYFYQDISWYAQDTWKLTPRLTLDLGHAVSPTTSRITTSSGRRASSTPSSTIPAKAPRIYRPVCVGASTCSAGQAAYRALDPATSGTPTAGQHSARASWSASSCRTPGI